MEACMLQHRWGRMQELPPPPPCPFSKGMVTFLSLALLSTPLVVKPSELHPFFST